MNDVENFMGIPAEAFVSENANKIHRSFYAHDALRIVSTAASDRNWELRQRDTTVEFFDRLVPIASSSTTDNADSRVSPTNSDSEDLKEINVEEFRALEFGRKGSVDASPEEPNLQNQTENLVHHATSRSTSKESEQEFRARKLKRKGTVDASPEEPNLQNQTENLVHHATFISTSKESEQEFRARKLRRKGAVDASPKPNLQNQTENLVHHATSISKSQKINEDLSTNDHDLPPSLKTRAAAALVQATKLTKLAEQKRRSSTLKLAIAREKVAVATQMVATANQVVGSPRLQAAAASPSNIQDDNLANRATSGTILPTASLVEATKLIERADKKKMIRDLKLAVAREKAMASQMVAATSRIVGSPRLQAAAAALPEVAPVAAVPPEVGPVAAVLPEVGPVAAVLPEVGPVAAVVPEVGPVAAVLPEIVPPEVAGFTLVLKFSSQASLQSRDLRRLFCRFGSLSSIHQDNELLIARIRYQNPTNAQIVFDSNRIFPIFGKNSDVVFSLSRVQI